MIRSSFKDLDVGAPPLQRASISLRLNMKTALSALDHFFSDAYDTVRANRQVSVYLYGWVIRNFNSGGRLQTPVWKPLAESTRQQKARQGYSLQPLLRTGHLRQSFAPFADAQVAGVGARASFGVDYAQVHQEGGGRVPQRDMLPPRDDALRYAVKVYQLQIETARRGAGL